MSQTNPWQHMTNSMEHMMFHMNPVDVPNKPMAAHDKLKTQWMSQTNPSQHMTNCGGLLVGYVPEWKFQSMIKVSSFY